MRFPTLPHIFTIATRSHSRCPADGEYLAGAKLIKSLANPLPNASLAKLLGRLITQSALDLIELVVRHDRVLLQLVLPIRFTHISSYLPSTVIEKGNHQEAVVLQEPFGLRRTGFLESLLLSLGFGFEVLLGHPFRDVVACAGYVEVGTDG